MSDLMSTVKILAGSTVEIAAASVGDQHLVATVRLAEENSSVETLNGLEVIEVSAEVPEEAGVEDHMIGRSDLKTGEGELEELPSALQAEVEETTVEVADDHVKSEADNPVEAEVYVESLASSEEVSVTEMESILELDESMSPVVMSEDDIISGPAEAMSETVNAVGEKTEEDKALLKEASVTEMESILELEESLRPVVMLSEDDTISGPAEAMSETVKAIDQKTEEDKASCNEHEPAATETDHSDLTAPPIDLEEALQATTEPAEEVVAEIMLDAVEEAKPVKASEEAVESGDVTMTMAQA